MQNLPENKLYTIGEAAGFLGISINTLKRWEAKGRISAGRTPTGIRVFKGQDIASLKSTFEPNYTAHTISLPSTYKTAFFVLCFLLILLSGITLFTVFQYSPIPREVSDRFTTIQEDLKQKASAFLVSLLEEGIKNSTIIQNKVKVALSGVNVSSSIPQDLNINSLLLDSNLTVGGTLNVYSQSFLDSLFVTNDLSVGGDTSIDGTLSVAGTINSNTFTSSSLIFSGTSASIYPSTPNTTLSLDAGTTGTVNIGGSSTGDVHLAGGSSKSGCTVTNNNGTLNCSGSITSSSSVLGTQIHSTVTTGTAPLVVASTTVVPNLNASLLEGNTAAALIAQAPTTNPNLVLNSDFSRRNKWMTFMPETFPTETPAAQGWTLVTGSSIGTVSGNILTAGGTATWRVRAGLSAWRDARFSVQVKLTEDDGNIFHIAKYADADNNVRVDLRGGAQDSFGLRKIIAGVDTLVTSVAFAPTLNNWYWIELEAQGTKYIAKLYSSGASPVAKSSATLEKTLTADITESTVTTGQLSIGGGGATIASQWGGLSTGDGGVYVEGWGPESWTFDFNGTKGGQAIGFDESTNSGPLTKQLTMRAYIPATSRWIDGYSNLGSDGQINASTAYTHSGYIKTSSKGGTGALMRLRFVEAAGGSFVAQADVDDAGETSWTRKTQTVTTNASTRQQRVRFMINPDSTATGTGFFQLPQLELGSVVTPWKNAPSDTVATDVDVQVFTGASNWKKPANAKTVKVIAIGAGGGGGSGRAENGTTQANAAGGGGGGARVERVFHPDALGATEIVSVGIGGSGGAGNAAVSNGNNGTTGGNSSFGSHVTAYGGGGGQNGNGSGGSWGGSGGGSTSAGGVTAAGGGPIFPGTASGNNRTGSGGAYSAEGGAGGNAEHGGASGGGGTNGGTGQEGGSAITGGAGGGSGGNYNNIGGEAAGRAGGANNSYTAGGGGTAGTTNGGAGGSGTSRSGTGKSGDGGGGGGGQDSGTGGGGGGGGLPGGGGGGGGGVAGGGTSGAGGAGGRGEVIVMTWISKFDLAEEYTVEDQSIEAGDIVKLINGSETTVGKTVGGYDQSILGIISTDPGITLGNYNSLDGSIADTSSDRYTRTNLRPVALQGRVPVKVTNENGPIKRGDILTSSNTLPGYAMKATKAGRSIGIAMEDLPVGVNEGKVMTFVNLSFYDPQVYITDAGTLSLVKSSKLNVQSEPIALGENGLIDTTETKQSFTYQIQNTITKEIIERIGAFNNLFVANLKVGSIDVDSIKSKELDEFRVQSSKFTVDIASLSGRLEFLEQTATQSSTFDSLSAGVLGESIGTGSASFNDLTIFNKLITTNLGVTGTIQSGLLSIEGINSLGNSAINTLNGDLYLQNNLLGGINILSGKILIDKDGNLKIENKLTAQIVEAEKFVSTKASGSSVLPANTVRIDVISQNATENARILITPTTLTDKILTVTSKDTGKFTVSIKQLENQDIKFDWFIIN